MGVKRFIGLCCLSLWLPISSFAQVPCAGTPAACQLNSWLAAFDAADFKVYVAYLGKNFPTGAASRTHDEGLRRNTAGFDLAKMEQDTSTKVTALLQERLGDGLARISIQVGSKEPYEITAITIEPVFVRPPDLALPHLSENGLVASLRSRLSYVSDADAFSGTVLLATDGKILFQQAYGMADREHSRANTLTTRFSVGSLNKMFTAVSILQLAQAGKLKLDDPVGKYLTDYPNKELASTVTLAELLNHTGGTGDIFGPEFDKHRADLRTLQDYILLYGSRALLFKPGSRFDYSNYGFILLGTVIERVTGETYYQYVGEHIYAPSGMTSTGQAPKDQPVGERSLPYSRADTGQWRPMAVSPADAGTSAGGGYSTVGDLLNFANALKRNRLLNAKYTELLTTGTVDTALGQYAYGFEVRLINGARCFGHGGVGPGINAELQICMASRYVVAVLANMDAPAALRVSDFIVGRLPSTKTEVATSR